MASTDFNNVLVKSLRDMGFAESNIHESVRLANGDAASALDMLLMWKEEEEEAVVSDDDNFAYLPVAASAQPAQILSISSEDVTQQASLLRDYPMGNGYGKSPYDDPPAMTQSGSLVDKLPAMTISPPITTPAAPQSSADSTIIYSEIPDVSKLKPCPEVKSGDEVVYGVLPPDLHKSEQRRAFNRAESLHQLYKIVERSNSVLSEQQSGNAIASQLRNMLYTPDGKRRNPPRSSAPVKLAAKRAAPSREAAIKMAQPGNLTATAPMHVIHYAMLQATTGLPVSVNVFKNKKYAKSFIGHQAGSWIRTSCRGVDANRCLEILKKLVRGRFFLQIDYKEELRAYRADEVYRLNPKSKLLLNTKSSSKPSNSNSKPSNSSNSIPATTSNRNSRTEQRTATTVDPELSADFASFSNYDWYHQRISKTVAEQRVGTMIGNFLLRDSSRPGCLCITYVSAKRGVSHVLVEKTNGKWSMKGAPTSWVSVPELLHTYRKVYANVIAPPKRPSLQRSAAEKSNLTKK